MKNRLQWIALLGLSCMLSLLLYAQAMGSFFVSDDWHWLDAAARQGTVLPNLLTNYAGDRMGGSYNPVSSLWINGLYQLFGLDAAPYHIASIVLHGIAAWLAAVLMWQWLGFVGNVAPELRKAMAWVTGLLFVLWPTHVEAVAWISSVPHVLATAFAAVACICYLRWRLERTVSWSIAASLAMAAAIFSKESVIALPIALLLLEYWDRRAKQPSRFALAIAFCGIALVFMAMRFVATGILFGSYAESTFVLRPVTWLHTALTFIEELATLGLVRQPWSELYFSYPYLIAPFAVAIVLVLLWRIARVRPIRPLLLTGFISLLPFVPLGFNRLSQEGERYTYFPSIFFIMAITLLLFRLKNMVFRAGLLLTVVLLSGAIVSYKSFAWSAAGSASRQLLLQFNPYVSQPREYVFVALPDTIGGAHVFRNNIREAIQLTYPEFRGSIVHIPVYTQQSLREATSRLSWVRDERGFFGYAPSQHQITGVDRAVTDYMTYELWGYDYTTFSSDTVRLILNEDLKQRLASDAAMLLTWNEGVLRELPVTGQN